MNSSPAESIAAGPMGIAAEKNKQWQREVLMEKIRSRSSQQRTFQELSKTMRISMLEKRYALDAVEKSNLQKCLDSMQHCIKVTSRQGLVERLESLSRQLGLKFMDDTTGLFISTDMFYLEIILDGNGALTDVKVHHECNEAQSCSELVNCLNRGDFVDFMAQLEGLSSIYQLNAEPKIKTKAFVALQAMEADLYSLYEAQNFSVDPKIALAESSVGIVLKRRGGHPMRLTYFVSPYDLLNLEAKSLIPLTSDLIGTKNIGMSVTVNLEASSANKLQISPTVSFNKDGMLSIPMYAPLTSQNSILLPATFVLRLNKPLPVSHSMLRALVYSDAYMSMIGDATASIMSVILKTASDSQVQNCSKGLFVYLPDQTHCYYFTDNTQMPASIVKSVPFTEPSQVPKILAVLKKHALFYTLLSSCVRPQSKMMVSDLDSMTILEVSASTFNQISVSLEHPYEESMASVEFNLNDHGGVTCEIFSIPNNYEALALKLTSVAQQTLSIPITIRSLLKYWDQERIQCFQQMTGDYGNFSMTQGPSDPGGRVTNSDYLDIKGAVKLGGVDCGGPLNGSYGHGANRPFYHPATLNNSPADGFPELNSQVGLLKQQFKTEVKQEDFCKSPRSNLTLQTDLSSNDSNSLGKLSAAASVVHGGTSKEKSMYPSAAANVLDVAASGVAVSSSASLPTSSAAASASGSASASASAYAALIKNDPDGKYSKVWKDKTGIKNTVSITPISVSTPSTSELSNPSTARSQTNTIDKKHGIEIIPLTSLSSQNPVSTTITITPINPNGASTSATVGLKTGDKRSTSSVKRSTDDKETSKSEKKRRKKRDDSPMGPPEKLFSRQNSPASDPNCLSRKYSPQSTHGAAGTKPSPKNSPVYSSPKNASSSPKSTFGTLSPKHGGSGKPSMSTLKNATSPKHEKSTLVLPTRPLSSSAGVTSTKIREKDSKERLLSVSQHNSKNPTSPKVKPATIKLKPLDVGNHIGISGTSTTSEDGDKTRKGSLSDVIDKLTSSQTGSDDSMSKMISPTLSGHIVTDMAASRTARSAGGTPSSSEYMVKSSNDGIKITINKTKSKDGGSSSNRSKASNAKFDSTGTSAGCLKKHTGLKPGVNSGPASKKSSATSYSMQNSMSMSKSSTNVSGSASQTGTKHNFQKSNSSGNLSTKLAASGSNSSLTKSHSTNSFHSDSFRRSTSGGGGKSRSNVNAVDKVQTRADPTDVMKILQFASPNMPPMEGFMKTFNTKFQIPKLSARNSNPPSHDSTSDALNKSRSTSTTATPSTPASFPSPQMSNPTDNSAVETNKNLQRPPAAYVAKGQQQDFFNMPCHPSNSSVLTSTSAPISTPTAHYNSYRHQLIDMNNHANDLSMRPPSLPSAIEDINSSSAAVLKNDIKILPPTANTQSASAHISNKLQPFHQPPPSPSVSVHILKSPVPSPLVVMPSSHSNSPCITDDELMDEALVGVGTK